MSKTRAMNRMSQKKLENAIDQTESLIAGQFENLEIGDTISIMHIETVWYKKAWRWITRRPQAYKKYYTVR